MRGWMTNRHEGCVSTMLTDKRLEYCTTTAPLQGSGATKWRMHADKHGISGVFRLDNAGPTRPIASPGKRACVGKSIHVGSGQSDGLAVTKNLLSATSAQIASTTPNGQAPCRKP